MPESIQISALMPPSVACDKVSSNEGSDGSKMIVFRLPSNKSANLSISDEISSCGFRQSIQTSEIWRAPLVNTSWHCSQICPGCSSAADSAGYRLISNELIESVSSDLRIAILFPYAKVGKNSANDFFTYCFAADLGQGINCPLEINSQTILRQS